MPQTLALLLFFSAAASAQIWPESWHGSRRTKTTEVKLADPMLWAEYGGEATERAVYDGPVGKFSATAWRLRDATSALAWYQASRPAACVPERGALLACTTPGAELLAHDNYVLQFDGWRPLQAEMVELYAALPRMRSGGGLPVLPSYLPDKDRVRNSERYLMGVHSLSQFLPGVPAELVGFEDGVEGQVGRFSTSLGEMPLVIFYFHSPQMAQAKLKEFARQPGWVLKRSGPMVGVAPKPTDAKAAESLLSGLDWQAQIIGNQPTKLPPMPNVGGMLIAIFELTGVLLVVCVGGGLMLAMTWLVLRKRRERLGYSDEVFTLIQLRD